MRRRASLIASTLLILASCQAPPPSSAAGSVAAACPDDVSAERLILARQAGMHMSATLLNRGFKDTMAAGGDLHSQVPGAEGLQAWASGLSGLFPRCTAVGHTRAGPQIWADPVGFENKAVNLGTAAGRLAELAAANDKAGFAAQVDVVQQSCAACHAGFRLQAFPTPSPAR